MTTNKEMNYILKTSLHDLLKLKKDNAGLDIKGLDEMIIRAEAAMDAEDVAYVEKKISKL